MTSGERSVVAKRNGEKLRRRVVTTVEFLVCEEETVGGDGYQNYMF